MSNNLLSSRFMHIQTFIELDPFVSYKQIHGCTDIVANLSRQRAKEQSFLILIKVYLLSEFEQPFRRYFKCDSSKKHYQ